MLQATYQSGPLKNPALPVGLPSAQPGLKIRAWPSPWAEVPLPKPNPGAGWAGRALGTRPGMPCLAIRAPSH